MRTTLIAATLILGLVAAPAAGRAQSLGCIVGPADNMPCSVGSGPAALLAAVAAPALVAGAAVTIADTLTHRTVERLPANLTYVPDVPDPYREPAGKKQETPRKKPSAAFQFNETATNVAIGVTGAMVVGAMIATIVHEAHK